MTIANIITASAAALGVATSIINQAEALDANHHPQLRKLDADDASSLSLSMPSKIENIDNVGSALIEEVEPKSSLEAVDTGILSSKASKSKSGKGSKACPLDDIDSDGFDGIIAANDAGRCYLSAGAGGRRGYVCRDKPCVYTCDCYGVSSGVRCSGSSGRKKCTCKTRPNSYEGQIGDCCASNRDCGSYNCSEFSPDGDKRCARPR